MARPEEIALHARLVAQLPHLEELQRVCAKKNPLYSFYHVSSKLYRLQDHTAEIAQTLQDLAAGQELHATFLQLVKDGIGKTFDFTYHSDWSVETRPIVEAFLHARTLLDCVVSAAKTPCDAEFISNEWATVLLLFNLRRSVRDQLAEQGMVE